MFCWRKSSQIDANNNKFKFRVELSTFCRLAKANFVSPIPPLNTTQVLDDWEFRLAINWMVRKLEWKQQKETEKNKTKIKVKCFRVDRKSSRITKSNVSNWIGREVRKQKFDVHSVCPFRILNLPLTTVLGGCCKALKVSKTNHFAIFGESSLTDTNHIESNRIRFQ